MDFSAEYANLERRFLKQVKKDNENGSPHAHYIANFTPKSPVDFVLIAMEPSFGGWKHEPTVCNSIHDPKSKNFCGSLQDFILHFCANKYLCDDGQLSYHLTDLAKTQMMVKSAAGNPWDRYKRWYPLLLQELELVAKPEARIISIGRTVERFLSQKALPRHVGRVVHYSGQAAGHWGVEPASHAEAYKVFTNGISLGDIEPTVVDVLTCEPNSNRAEEKIEQFRNSSGLTESKKKLMFTYKIQFDNILAKAG